MVLMVDNSVSHDFYRASRKAEETALRRYEAVHWLECTVGPLGIPNEPTEREFIACLRNGIILCNLINKIHPGTISKVVDNHVPTVSETSIWDSRPLPAYQYFENVRNFLVAVKKLNLPAFEAPDLERENIEVGSAARIADCILALKAYHEWKEWSGGNGVYKHVTVKSPLVLHSAAKNFSKPLSNNEAVQSCRQLDMSPLDNRKSLTDSIVKVLSEHMVDSKENMSTKFLTSLQKGNQDPVQMFSKMLSRCLEEKLRSKFPALNLEETKGSKSASHPRATSILQENLSMKNNSQHHKAQSRIRRADLWRMLKTQETDLTDIKTIWSETKREFGDLQNQLMNDLIHLGSLVEELSNPARGYQKVIQENRKLYNMVQDLKGNIRVHCRIRPMFNSEAKKIISFRAEDGTVIVSDPSKHQSEGRKVYQFNHVYGPIATQDELFKDVQPLIRSVMDGYNVCILAYGQPESGKTYTMYGPLGASEKEMGINIFALNDLFKTIDMKKNTTTYELRLQMVEICNEQIRDLLADAPARPDETTVSNVTSHAVKSITEAIDLVKQGEVRRNSENNCSHSVVTIHVKGKDLSGKNNCSRLHLVDLAGNGEDEKLLSCLEDVITSLSQKQSCIHYKDTKLTSLLQDTFGGKAKILVFAHVIQDGDSFTKTISTLEFAQRISTIDLGAAQSSKTNCEVTELKNEIEILKRALGDKTTSSPQPTKQLKSPFNKQVVSQRTPVKSRRLSMENQVKLPKSPVGRQNTTTEATPLRSRPKSPLGRQNVIIEITPPRSLRRSVENLDGRKPGIGKRLSVENPVIAKSEKTNKMKESKSSYGEKKGSIKVTPPRTRRSSIENSIPVKPDIDIKKSNNRVRRLSLEGPKDSENKISNVPKTPPQTYPNGPTFTDCAEKFPSKTPEQHNSRVYVLPDFQTPGNEKSTNGKRSQIKKSLRTIGKLIHGSEKRNQQKVDSTSTKVKEVANRAKSPPPPKLSRQSLTNLPPPGNTRRTSLGGTSTCARQNENKNAVTPPSVRSSINTGKRWM